MRTFILINIVLCYTAMAQTRLELYMADPEVRIAQKIYCQIENVVPTDKLQTIMDGNIIFEKTGSLKSEEIFVADYRNQKAGAHQLIVRILDQYNQVKAAVTKTWTTLHDGIPTVGIDENNSLRVNGELYFPIYAMVEDGDFKYFVENDYMNSGANEGWNPEGYSVNTYRDWLDLCHEWDAKNIGPGTRWEGLGIRTGRDCDTTAMKNYVNALKNHPAQLIWQWADEPDGGGNQYCAFSNEIRSWTDICHRNDTNHPHAVNLVAYDWTWDLNYYVNHCGDYSFLYGADWHNGEKKLIADIVGFDYYPIEFATDEHFPGPVTFANLAKALDRLREWNYNLCPIFSWIENCDLSYGEYTNSEPYPNFTPECTPPNCCTPGVNCPASDRSGNFKENSHIWTPAPTPVQMWSEYWLKVIHGVKGFKIHPYFAPDGHAQPPSNHDTMAKFLKWITHLTPAVLGPESNRIVTDDANTPGHRVDFMVREVEDYIYIFAARLTEVNENDDPPINVAFNIEGFNSSKAQVYEEDRSINIVNGKFQDSFDPWDVHVYKIFKDEGLPVELMKLEGHVIENGIELRWSTASEYNNYGFEVQRSQNSTSNFKKIGFVNGYGTSNKVNQYCFVDRKITRGTYYYQLKQIDCDGSFKIIGKIEITVGLPNGFKLNQNYPNPFNPSSMISYSLAKSCYVKLTIYDINSKEVYRLVDEFQKSGYYSITWNASNFASGSYFYTLKADNYNETKRMLLVK